MSAFRKTIVISRRVWTFLLVVSLITSTIVFSSKPAEAAAMQMKTGYYVGSGSSISITGLGFTPDLVIIKGAATTGMVFKTSAMPASNTAFLTATANNTGSNLVLNSDGFTVGTGLTNVNALNNYFQWSAYGGSDCSSTGNFCVGTYTGSGGGADRLINTGFQPTIGIVKNASTILANFRTASMPTDRAEHFSNAAAITTGRLFDSFASNGMTIGRDNNLSAATYYFVAFKSDASVAEGSYTGNAVDDRAITGLGFLPSVVFIKNSTSATANNRRAMYSGKYHHGDYAGYTADAVADVTNFIQGLDSGGFRVGTGANTNENAVTHYWFAFGNEVAPTVSGSFEYEQGVYTGTGANGSVTGLGFAPDLVIIKVDTSTGVAVMRTRMMQGDATAHLGATSVSFAGGITSLDSDGFSLGTSALVNSSGLTYRWQAFGNAYDPLDQSGATDFAIGAYRGSGLDGRNIGGVPFQPDLVIGRSSTSGNPPFRTSAHVGDVSSYFASVADAPDAFQQLNSDGFQVGITGVNTSTTLYYWVAFKAGDNLRIGSYTGDGVDNRFIPMASFRPDLLWIKAINATSGVHRSSTITTNSTQSFVSLSNFSGGVKELNGGGFTLGTSSFVNSATNTYRYVAWRDTLPETLTTAFVNADTGIPLVDPTIQLQSVQSSFTCSQSTGRIGDYPEVLRISNQRMNAAWTTSIAATGGPTANWLDSGTGRTYDYNDPTSAGCGDGGDADSLSGQLTVQSSFGFAAPETFCSLTNVSMGSDQSFSQGSVDAITLASASIGANTACFWDIQEISINQEIPAEQPSGTYQLPMTITTVAS